jgi:hypothetical protein
MLESEMDSGRAATDDVGAIHPRTRELIAVLDTTRAELRRVVAAVPPTRMMVRPAAGRWSVGEILEHLAIVEGRIAGMLAAQLAGAREKGLGRERETSPVAPMLDMERIVDRTRPRVAGDASQPRGGIDAAASLAALDASRGSLRTAVIQSSGLALADVTMPHPALGPLNLYQWVLFVGGHEARHTAQIREIIDGGAP